MSQASTTETDPALDSWLVKAFALAALMAVIFCLLITVLSFAARWSHLCDLATHWKLQIAGASAIATAVLCFARRRRVAVIGALVLLVNVAYLAPLYVPRSIGRASSLKLRILSSNVLSANRDSERLLRLVDAEKRVTKTGSRPSQSRQR